MIWPPMRTVTWHRSWEMDVFWELKVNFFFRKTKQNYCFLFFFFFRIRKWTIGLQNRPNRKCLRAHWVRSILSSVFFPIGPCNCTRGVGMCGKNPRNALSTEEARTQERLQKTEWRVSQEARPLPAHDSCSLLHPLRTREGRLPERLISVDPS